jgi:hypothetical protein
MSYDEVEVTSADRNSAISRSTRSKSWSQMLVADAQIASDYMAEGRSGSGALRNWQGAA